MQTINLSPRQQQVFDLLKANPEGMTPTEIGMKCNIEYKNASGWACSTLVPLLRLELVRKEKVDKTTRYYAQPSSQP